MVEAQISKTTQEPSDVSDPYEKRVEFYLEDFEQLERDLPDFSITEKIELFEMFKDQYPEFSAVLKSGFRNEHLDEYHSGHKPKIDITNRYNSRYRSQREIYVRSKKNTRNLYLNK